MEFALARRGLIVLADESARLLSAGYVVVVSRIVEGPAWACKEFSKVCFHTVCPRCFKAAGALFGNRYAPSTLGHGSLSVDAAAAQPSPASSFKAHEDHLPVAIVRAQGPLLLAGFTHEPVVELSEKLAQLTSLGHAFYGASDTEIAHWFRAAPRRWC